MRDTKGPIPLTTENMFAQLYALMNDKQTVFAVYHSSDMNTPFKKVQNNYNQLNKRNQTSQDNPLNNMLSNLKKTSQNKVLPEAIPAYSKGNKNQI